MKGHVTAEKTLEIRLEGNVTFIIFYGFVANGNEAFYVV